MSVYTRTSRTPSPSSTAGGPPPVKGRGPRESPGPRTRGFVDDEPQVSPVKVPCDPAQVIVSHASFRVRLGSPPPLSPAVHDTAPIPAPSPAASSQRPGTRAPSTAPAGAPSGAKRRAPVVWSGRTEPGDASATKLLQAVRAGAVTTEAPDGSEAADGVEPAGAVTQVLPRVEEDGPAREAAQTTVLGPPRGPRPPERAGLVPERPYGGESAGFAGFEPPTGAFPETSPHGGGAPEVSPAGGARQESGRGAQRRGDAVRHAYYPGRRLDLGVVLLPLRIFLGFISLYAGMSKLCDPVYFDGGERGSMVTWLRSLEPWTIATPLHDFALDHPVGAGLTVAFLQVIVGVLTVCGLWQRLAAAVGALLSAALLITVSWRTVPVYDAPDIIYLAAWSPLVIAGAPVYSLDARLAGEAWRTLGPRVDVIDLRRRVLRRGGAMATVILGLSLLLGSLFGGAVRSAQVTTVPGPHERPTNQQPGSPLPERSNGGAGAGTATQGPGDGRGPDADTRRSPSPSATSDERRGEAGSASPNEREQPGARESTTPRQQPPPAPDSPEATGGSGSPEGSASGSPSGASSGPTGAEGRSERLGGSGDQGGTGSSDGSGSGAGGSDGSDGSGGSGGSLGGLLG